MHAELLLLLLIDCSAMAAIGRARGAHAIGGDSHPWAGL